MIRRLPLIGAIAIAAGFAVIGGSWWGAHNHTYVDEQFPALVAGGLAGLGCIVLGAAALAVHVHHRNTERLLEHLRTLGVTTGVESAPPASASLATPHTVGPDTVGPDTVGPDTADPDTAGADVAGPDDAVVSPPTHISANGGPKVGVRNDGHQHSNGRQASTANGHSNGDRRATDLVDGTSPFVVPRRTLFHDPSCRLVTTRDDAEVIARPDAVAAGLAACRVCRP